MQLLANTTSPYVRIARIALAEKGVAVAPTLVDPWADDERLRQANAATRVPTLITDDGTPLAESLLIVMWLERQHPGSSSLLGSADVAGVLSRAGMALGVIDAAVHTIIIRKVTAPVVFDDTPVGLRRRRTMAEGMQRLEALAASGAIAGSAVAGSPVAGSAVASIAMASDATPTLDAITAVVALDYLRFRFADAPWMPAMPALDQVSLQWRARASFSASMPR